jgi:hypothetical protein
MHHGIDPTVKAIDDIPIQKVKSLTIPATGSSYFSFMGLKTNEVPSNFRMVMLFGLLVKDHLI